MDGKSWLELLGYLASVLVAVSLMMSRIVRLRVINLVGSLAFTVYGALIGAYPVAAVNAFICLINLWFLAKMLRAKEYFRLLEIEPGSEYLRYFLSFHADDVRRYEPDFSHAPSAGETTLFVLRDLVPAGLFIGDREGDGTMRVRLDYVIPAFRDFKIGRYLYAERADYFREHGIHTLVASGGTREHADYLRRMGFVPDASAPDLYRLKVG
jgi:GNAT superfamily N-acetyltransferase